jgi:hypothetical protein
MLRWNAGSFESDIYIHYYGGDAVNLSRDPVGIPPTERATYAAGEFDDTVVHFDANAGGIDGRFSIKFSDDMLLKQ